jgi:hypothetical protein
MPGLKKATAALVPAVILLATMVPSAADAADRNVLVEYWTRVT